MRKAKDVMKRKIINVVICILLSLVAVYFIDRVYVSLVSIHYARKILGETLYFTSFVQLCTQLTCVVAVLLNVWTVYILHTFGQLKVNEEDKQRFNKMEIGYLIIGSLISILVYVVIAMFDVSKVSAAVWTCVIIFNSISVGLFLSSILIALALKKKK